jgi:hypothetical protein
MRIEIEVSTGAPERTREGGLNNVLRYAMTQYRGYREYLHASANNERERVRATLERIATAGIGALVSVKNTKELRAMAEAEAEAERHKAACAAAKPKCVSGQRCDNPDCVTDGCQWGRGK